MHECLLCERDMKKSKTVFGNGCINNIYKILGFPKPGKGKNKEQFLYKNIMKKANISNINKEQKIWLTDRYLTYQYIDKLQYGNFTKLKKQINEDIEKVNKVEKFEDLVTTKKMKLKEAYDLYKKERKFETNLDKIKNKNFKDDEELKLLITSMSFIFNMYRNKDQYEKNSFAAMQYAFWQTVVEVGRQYAGFDISADFLQHSLEEKPEDLVITEGKVVNKINDDEQFKEKLNEIVKKYGKNQNEFVAEGGDVDFHFNSNDLYFSIHSADTVIKGEKKNDKWNLLITFEDTYDYTKLKTFSEYYKDTNSVIKSMLSSSLYNLAYFSVKLGVMKEYKINIKFDINDYEVK